MSELRVRRDDGLTLHGTESGAGRAVVLLHGLTASRRYVVMGSKALERSGHRVIAYDARGHGRSSPAATAADYTYDLLADDLEAVLDACRLDRAVLVGASMGAHTLLQFALRVPDRVAGMVVITPAYDPATHDRPGRFDQWDALADGLRDGGIEGFIAANQMEKLPPAWRETVRTVIRQRLSHHDRLDAIVDALRVVPRSRPFPTVASLTALQAVPTVVVADRDDADPGHPLAVGEAYAEALGAELVVEEEGRSPIAWQGGQLSRVIARLVEQTEG